MVFWCLVMWTQGSLEGSVGECSHSPQISEFGRSSTWISPSRRTLRICEGKVYNLSWESGSSYNSWTF